MWHRIKYYACSVLLFEGISFVLLRQSNYILKRALLTFPTVAAMAEFILANKVIKVDADTTDCSITGLFSDELLVIAETQYGATLLYTDTDDVD